MTIKAKQPPLSLVKMIAKLERPQSNAYQKRRPTQSFSTVNQQIISPYLS